MKEILGKKDVKLRDGIREMKTKNFWIEWLSLYTSILIVTIIVQAIVLRMDMEVVLFCLTKSLVTTIINVMAIMLGRRISFIKRHWFLETILYTLASMPYVEIFLIYTYKLDFFLLIDMIKCYSIAYFIMGLFIKKYLILTKKIVSKIFNGWKLICIYMGFFVNLFEELNYFLW